MGKAVNFIFELFFMPVIEIKVVEKCSPYQGLHISLFPEMLVYPISYAGHTFAMFIGRNCSVLDVSLHFFYFLVLGKDL